MLEGLSPARRRFVLGLAVLALVAVVGIGAAVWANRDEAVRPVSQESQGPVLLVPGYNGGTTALEVLADALRSQGRSVVIVDLPGDNTGDLDDQARALDEAVVLQMQRDGARSVDVVGYSAGGVVARLWARDHGGDSLARRIVTIGSPHHGTDLAGLGADVAPDDGAYNYSFEANGPLITSVDVQTTPSVGPKAGKRFVVQPTALHLPPDGRTSGTAASPAGWRGPRRPRRSPGGSGG